MKKILTLAVVFVLLIPLFSVILPRAYATVTLTNGYVDPGNAPVTTTFYYYATYYDSSGRAPDLGCVVIDGSNSQFMHLYNGIPSNGVYRYGTTLTVGTHNYYFWFNIGGGGTIYLGYPSSPFSGPIVGPIQRLLTVSCAHDSPNPPNGNWHFDDGQYIACTVTSPVTEGSTVWACTGWTATGSVPHSGTGTSTGYFYITQDSSITWNWIVTPPVQRTLTVSSAHDSPSPPNGDNSFSDGQSVTCSVTSPVTEGSTVWTCTGWTGTGSVPSSGTGTTVTFTVTQDSSITWNWHGNAVQWKLTVVSPHGNASPSVGDHLYDDGSSVTCSVSSPVTEGNIVWTCTGWAGAGSVPPSGTDKTVTFTIVQDSSITWNWQGTPVQRTLTVASTHDTPVPSNGPHTYSDGQSVTCSVSSPVTEGGTIWTCTGWTGTGSVPLSGTDKIVTFPITQDSTITWNWVGQAIYSVTIGAHCNSEGMDVSVSVWIDSSTMYYTPHTFANLYGTHTLTASQYDTSGHSFKQWSTGSTSLAITVTSGGTYTAYYGATPRRLTVSSAHDTPSPGNGDSFWSDGQSVTCSVTSPVTEGSTVWTCTGWTGTGSVPSSGSGKTVTFTITQDSSITWNWQSQIIYSITMGAHCNTEGKDVSVSIWIDSSTSFYTPYTFSNLHGSHTFTASQYDTNGHSFKQWNIGSTSLTITVSSGGTYTAYYEALQRTLTVSSAHDSPVPGIGPHTYTDGQSVTCSVSSTVTEGSNVWTCTGWSGTGSVPSSGSGTSTSFIITKDSTINWNWQARLIGDLILVDFSPVQVVYGASALVANKPAVFKATVQSTFSQDEPIIIRFTYSGGSSTDYPLTIGANKQMTVFIPFVSSSLRQRGTFTWTARLIPVNQILDTDETNNIFSNSKTVIETNYLSILYVPLRSSRDAPVSAYDLNLMEKYGDQYVLETFPTPGIWSQVSPPQILAHDNLGCLLLTLMDIDGVARKAGFDRTVVILPNKNGHWLHDVVNGPDDTPGWTPTNAMPWGTTYWTICTVEDTYYVAIPHEIGHTYGRPGGNSEEYKANPPGNPASGHDPGRKVKVENALCFMTASAPYVKLGDPLSPFEYGNPPHNYGDYLGGYWICNTCYEALLGQLKKAGDPEVMYMGGVIFENDTVLLPTWSRVSYGVPDLPLGNTGNLRILFLDDTGNIIGQTGLNASFVYFSDEYYITAFSFAVEYPDATREIQLLLDDNVVVNRNVTLHSPTVSVMSPNGGEVVTAGDDCLISWNSSDLDGDQLTHDLFYSGDGGGHWTPIAMGLSQTNYLWNTNGLNRGTGYLVKVIANDGVNTGENVSSRTFMVRVHDVAPTIIIPSKSFVGQNSSMSLNITVENRGDFAETLNVTLYANGTAIGDIQNISLNSENLTICFAWNTTGFEYGNYRISAYVWPIENETNPTDNTLAYSSISVTIRGDVNGDFIVDIYDAITLAGAFNSVPGTPRWNTSADINGDNIVDIYDAIILAGNFNKHVP